MMLMDRKVIVGGAGRAGEKEMKDDDETTNDPEKVTSEKDALKNVPGRGDGLERSIHGQGSGRSWGQ